MQKKRETDKAGPSEKKTKVQTPDKTDITELENRLLNLEVGDTQNELIVI